MSVLTPIEVPAGKNALRIMNNTGDTTIAYDPSIDVEVAEAMEAFDESMKKGMVAFALDGEGGGTVTREFDKTAPQIVVTSPYAGG
jgi:hypothetical protein